jgi:hypothetical protein
MRPVGVWEIKPENERKKDTVCLDIECMYLQYCRLTKDERTGKFHYCVIASVASVQYNQPTMGNRHDQLHSGETAPILDITDDYHALNSDEEVQMVHLFVVPLAVDDRRGLSGNALATFVSVELQHAIVMVETTHHKIILDFGKRGQARNVAVRRISDEGKVEMETVATSRARYSPPRGITLSVLKQKCQEYSQRPYNLCHSLLLRLPIVTYLARRLNGRNCQSFADEIIEFLTGKLFEATKLILEQKTYVCYQLLWSIS